ncbi:hypothetical protein CDAR_7741 [Caerostris darwini]|uniref:Uncharacterized protein n=1 Tax=Caerostris darwini TaxID=1538125 RepID=A0AAV4R9A4_9ARAC|nr:hypothetical protein CDAR_7741 [Caerostris darwini]
MPPRTISGLQGHPLLLVCKLIESDGGWPTTVITHLSKAPSPPPSAEGANQEWGSTFSPPSPLIPFALYLSSGSFFNCSLLLAALCFSSFSAYVLDEFLSRINRKGRQFCKISFEGQYFKREIVFERK